MDDVLDKFSTEMLRRKAKEKTRSRTRSKVQGLIPKLKFKFNVRLEVEEITHRLQEISERKDMSKCQGKEKAPKFICLEWTASYWKR